MNLHHLQVFFAVAEEGSFTLGAESLARIRWEKLSSIVDRKASR